MLPLILAAEARGPKVIRLNLGEPNFNIPGCVKDAIKLELDKNNTHYCDPQGILPLRQAIAEQIFHSRGLNISPDQVVVLPGAKPAIGFSQEIYCDPGEEILYPSPGFPIYESFIPTVGGIPKALVLQEKNNFALTPDLLEQNLSSKTKLLYLNYPSNPTGGILSAEEIKTLGQVILNKAPADFRIFSDEIYEDILFDGNTLESFSRHPELGKKTIICSGFSKSYAWTGGRLGYAVLPTVEEAAWFKAWNINYFSCVSPYQQAAAVVALNHPESQEAVKQMVATFQKRRDLAHGMLINIPSMHCIKPAGAFYLFPNVGLICGNLGILDVYEKLSPELKTQYQPSTIFQKFLLEEHAVAVMDRPSFSKAGSENQHFIRLSIAANEADLVEGIKRIKEASDDYQGCQRFLSQNYPI
ncbi:MAG: pyridoxal phosphate-dependent aminotransferase [Gammaproteobacteria bacterium]